MAQMTPYEGNIHDNPSGRRLIKLWLPAAVVRDMDATIEGSGGAYTSREEFVTEAVRDRIGEERHGLETPQPTPRRGGATSGQHSPRLSRQRQARAARQRQPAHEPWPFDDEQEASLGQELGGFVFGEWVTGGREIPTLPPAGGPSTNFGLHNRDLPTLFALDFLGRLVAEAREPVDWDSFIRQLSPVAWQHGRRLRADDLRRRPAVKAAAGFPTNQAKPDAAERRFLEHAVGSPKPATGASHGPLFVFRLVGMVGEGKQRRVAPTERAVQLVSQLAEAGIADGPPFSEAAWRAFESYLREEALEELRMWLAVLAVLRDRPDREGLVERCSWWHEEGRTLATAETNAMGYVARGREWSLVEPTLVGGRYRLKALGEDVLERLGEELHQVSERASGEVP